MHFKGKASHPLERNFSTLFDRLQKLIDRRWCFFYLCGLSNTGPDRRSNVPDGLIIPYKSQQNFSFVVKSPGAESNSFLNDIMMIKTILPVLLVSVTCTLVLAQNQTPASMPTQPLKGNGHIFGIVKDSTTQHVVEFANIAINDPKTNKPIDGTIADEHGKFSITKVPAGTFNVVISFIGLETKTIANVRILDKKTDIDLGTINIGPVAKLLKEVVVEGQRSLIEEKVDRTVYNAENDQTAKGGDATDVLKRVPMLSVDMDGNVSLRGSQNIKVLINNKPSTITASSVADALKQIPADQIKTVEVITSPSAKYDAEGSAGIINIITKKNTLQGLTLNIDGASGFRGTNLGLNGGYRKGKMGLSLGGFGRSSYNIPGHFENNQLTTAADGSQTLNIQSANTHRNDIGGRYNLGWDYDLNKNNSLTASVQYGGRNSFNNQNHLLTQSYQNDALLTSSLKDVKVTDLSNTVDASLTYTHTFEKPQREFSLMTLYSRNNRSNNFVNNLLNESDFSTDSFLKNVNKSFNQEVTIQGDYQTPIGTNQLVELGGKNIARKVSSDYKYFSAGSDGIYTPLTNSALANIFNYNQNVTSGYLAYTLSLPSGYSLKAGSRYEYTTINAHFQDEQNIGIPSYGVLVPSLNFSKKLKNGATLKLAYNRRIQRPSIQYLNPNIQASNPLNISFGNPNLSPEYTNNYELSYNTFIKGTSLNFSTFMRNTDNSIQSLRHVKGDTIVTTYANIGKEDTYGFSVFANVNISNKFSLNGGSDVYYAMLKNNNPDPLYNASNEGWVYNIRMFGNYKLDKGWGLQFFGFYRGRQVLLQGFQGGFGVYSMSVRKDLPNKKGSIGLGADNFFTPAMYIRNSTQSPVIDQHSVNTLHNMNFKISFSYRIGKMTFDAPKKRRKSISNDDMKEGGGDNASNAAQGGQQQTTTPQGAATNGAATDQNGNGRKGAPQGNRPKQAWPKQDSTKQDSLKQNWMRRDSLKQDSTRQDSLRQNLIKSDSLRRDSTNQVKPIPR